MSERSKVPREIEFWYEFAQIFDITTPLGQKRLKATRDRIKKALEETGVEIHKGDKVLALMAGTCIEAVALAEACRDKELEIVCAELREEAVKKGVKWAEERGIKLKGLTCDVREIGKYFKEEEFNGVLLWGNSLPHLSIWDADKVFEQCYRLLKPNGWFLIEQRDLIFEILPRYESVFIEREDVPVISFHAGFDPTKGSMRRLVLRLDTGERILIDLYFWSPWLVKYVLEKNGFKDVKIAYVYPRHVICGFKK